MKTTFTFSAAAIALVLVIAGSAVAQAPAPASDAPPIVHLTAAPGALPQRFNLALNKAVIIELDTDTRDVVVGNAAIADAVVKTPRRIFLMALKIGQTTAMFLDSEGHQIANLEVVVGADVADLNDELA